MKTDEQSLAQIYAEMSNDQLLALAPDQLTDAAQGVLAAELARRGFTEIRLNAPTEELLAIDPNLLTETAREALAAELAKRGIREEEFNGMRPARAEAPISGPRPYKRAKEFGYFFLLLFLAKFLAINLEIFVSPRPTWPFALLIIGAILTVCLIPKPKEGGRIDTSTGLCKDSPGPEKRTPEDGLAPWELTPGGRHAPNERKPAGRFTPQLFGVWVLIATLAFWASPKLWEPGATSVTSASLPAPTPEEKYQAHNLPYGISLGVPASWAIVLKQDLELNTAIVDPKVLFAAAPAQEPFYAEISIEVLKTDPITQSNAPAAKIQAALEKTVYQSSFFTTKGLGHRPRNHQPV